VVVGDLNEAGDGPVARALQSAGFSEACDPALCGEATHIERFFLRSEVGLSLRVLAIQREPAFLDSQRRPLSDHPAVSLKLGWSTGRAL
jgi:hypothetical protein